MSGYTLPKGETLSEGYYVQAHTDPDYEGFLVDVHGPDGIIAVLSFEEGDEDVVVHWPIDPEWERARTGSFTDVMRALEYGKYRLLSYQRMPESESSPEADSSAT